MNHVFLMLNPSFLLMIITALGRILGLSLAAESGDNTRLQERGKVLGQPGCGDLIEKLKVEMKPEG